jgi:hypothetical protein
VIRSVLFFQVPNQVVELTRHFVCEIRCAIELVRRQILLISGHKKLATDLSCGGLRSPEKVNEPGLRSTLKPFRALTGGKKYSWGAIFDMTLIAARRI